MNQRTCVHEDPTINTGKSRRTMMKKCQISFCSISSCIENVSASGYTILLPLTRGRNRTERVKKRGHWRSIQLLLESSCWERSISRTVLEKSERNVFGLRSMSLQSQWDMLEVWCVDSSYFCWNDPGHPMWDYSDQVTVAPTISLTTYLMKWWAFLGIFTWIDWKHFGLPMVRKSLYFQCETAERDTEKDDCFVKWSEFPNWPYSSQCPMLPRF